MNKKIYQKPATTAVVMAPASILCASNGIGGPYIPLNPDVIDGVGGA